MSIDELVRVYGDTYLICDCNHPLITHGSLMDEAKLYDLDSEQVKTVINLFIAMADKAIDADLQIDTLSGGQKVILSVLLAATSRATQILFYDLDRSLDDMRQKMIKDFLDSHRHRKEILMLDAISQ